MEHPPLPKTFSSKKIRASVAKAIQSQWFNRMVTILVVLDLLPLLIDSISTVKKEYWEFDILNGVSFTIFLLEYICRLVMAKQIGGVNRKQVKSRWKYLFSFYGIIDLLSIFPFVLPNFVDITHVSTHEIIAFARVILIFKLIRYSTSLSMVAVAIREVKSELITVFSAAIMVVIISAIMMFYAEHGAQPDKFRSVTDGMWWAVITFATVGYGDIYPITGLGKIIASVVSMLGIAMIALPSGIIGSSFRQVMANQREQKKQLTDQTNHEKMLDKLNAIEKKLDALDLEFKEKGETK